MPAAKARRNPPARAKRPGSLASFRKVSRRNEEGGVKSIAMRVGAGVGGFAGTNLGAFVLKKILANKLASFQKILGPVGGALVFGALWYGTKKIKMLSKYRWELLIGSGLAVAQHTLAALVPSLSWLGGKSAAPALPKPTPQQGMGAAPQRTRFVLPGEIESERADEAIRNGTWGKAQYTQPQQNADTDDDFDGAESPPDDSDLSDEAKELEQWDNEEDVLDDLKGGIFSN